MFKIIVNGPRRAVLAVHVCESSADVSELLAVYAALGFAPEALVVTEIEREQAA
jgi:acetolactate synthase small subunit